MKYLIAKLWGREIGRLVWETKTVRSYFMYRPDVREEIPDIAPLLSPKARRGDSLPISSLACFAFVETGEGA